MFLDTVYWLVVLQALGLSAVPVSFRLFHRLPDKGYAFSKSLSLMVIGYVTWIGGSFGIFPTTRMTGMLIVLGLGLIGAATFLVDKTRLVLYFKTRWRSVALTETVFVGSFLFWLLYRAFDPLIVSTEAPMDFAFLNASLIAESFPPRDPWLAGYSVSYYYFGYLMISVITEITGIIPPVAYNLGLASFAGLTSVSVFGLCLNLTSLIGKRGLSRQRRNTNGYLAGLFGVMLVLCISNLLGIIEFMRAIGIKAQGFFDWLQIKGMEMPIAESSLIPTDHWWWWRSSRVIDTIKDGQSLDYTITEFPFFSYLLGDMHPHLMAVPFLVLTLGTLCVVAMQDGVFKRKSWRYDLSVLVFLSWLIGGTIFVNTWEAAGLFLLCSLVYYRGISIHEGFGTSSVPVSLAKMALALCAVAIVATLLYIPFYLDFDSQASGIGFVIDPVTRYMHWAIVWGIFFIPIGFMCWIGFVMIMRRQGLRQPSFVMPVVLALGPFAVWAMSAFMVGESFNTVLDRFFHNLPLVFCMLIAFVMGLTSTEQSRDGARNLVWIVCGVALFLIVTPEMFYLKDSFDTRMNTIFKLYYQAWILLAIATPCILYYAYDWALVQSRKFRRVGFALFGVFGVLLIGSLYYPVGSILTKSENFANNPTLNGLNHVKRDYPGEYQAIVWLWGNAEKDSRILEAIGSDYDAATSRVSAATGIPTLLGWQGHEIQWRGTSNPLAGRAELVEAMYTAREGSELLDALSLHEIDYVILGHQERMKYGEEAGALFDEVMTSYRFSEGFALYVVPES